MTEVPTCRLSFADLRLSPRQAHYLRGYLGRVFADHSPLLHNHYADGGLRYGYPLVQYKVLGGVPTLLGLREGAPLLQTLFLRVRELQLAGTTYPLQHKQLDTAEAQLGLADTLITYRFVNPWLGLNEHNYQRYRRASPAERKALLSRVLTGNILSFYKGMDLRLAAHERILVQLQVQEKTIRFKNQPMMGFTGHFTTNALLPEDIGLGKAVSRGFGAIQKVST